MGVFDVGAGHFEAIFDGAPQNESTEDGGGGNRISGQVGKHIDTVDGDGFGDVLIGEVGGGNIDDFGGVEIFNRGRLECRRGGKLRKILDKTEGGAGDERV